MQLSCLHVNLEEDGGGRDGTVTELIMNALIITLGSPVISLFTSKHFWKFKLQLTSSGHLKTNAEKLNAQYDSFKSPLKPDAQIIS